MKSQGLCACVPWRAPCPPMWARPRLSGEAGGYTSCSALVPRRDAFHAIEKGPKQVGADTTLSHVSSCSVFQEYTAEAEPAVTQDEARETQLQAQDEARLHCRQEKCPNIAGARTQCLGKLARPKPLPPCGV